MLCEVGDAGICKLSPLGDQAGVFEGDEAATSRVDEELVRFQKPISSNQSNTLCKFSSSQELQVAVCKETQHLIRAHSCTPEYGTGLYERDKESWDLPRSENICPSHSRKLVTWISKVS